MGGGGLIEELFGVSRALIGMVHVGALPGTPRAEEPLRRVAETAVAETEALAAAGFHGVLIENMHDRPYLKRGVGPEITAAMAVLGAEIRRQVDLPLGIQVLAGANREALAVALACGADFVRVEGFAYAHVADEGLMESDAGDLLRYRRAIGAEHVRLFADVKKKHSAHALTADVDLEETARTAEFLLADAIVVTGVATGRPAAPAEVETVAAAVEVPVIVGSGVTAENLSRYAGADAWIVGSWLKERGVWTGPMDGERLRALVEAHGRLGG